MTKQTTSCGNCGNSCTTMGSDFEPRDMVPIFTRASFNQTAFWCDSCEEPLCGKCLYDTQRDGMLGRCPKCKSAVDYATNEQAKQDDLPARCDICNLVRQRSLLRPFPHEDVVRLTAKGFTPTMYF